MPEAANSIVVAPDPVGLFCGTSDVNPGGGDGTTPAVTRKDAVAETPPPGAGLAAAVWRKFRRSTVASGSR